MKILLTGASSFTGYWFAAALAAAGHHVVAPLRGGLDGGADRLRGERLSRLADKVELVADRAFGSASFLDIVNSQDFDLLCHHGAETTNYRSPDFDVVGAIASNTLNLRAVFKAIAARGAKGLILTGSYFEYDEGAGNLPLLAFSPYGLAKGCTAQIVRHGCHEVGLPYAKFVIPNPFGPLEQPRLGAYLAQTWKSGGVPQIKTPAYVRDNIHIGLLAAAYGRFIEQPWSGSNERKLNPSGYIESQGAFIQRLAREIGVRLNRKLQVELLLQTDFSEPVMRVNTDPATCHVADWNESKAWDEYATVFSSN